MNNNKSFWRYILPAIIILLSFTNTACAKGKSKESSEASTGKELPDTFPEKQIEPIKQNYLTKPPDKNDKKKPFEQETKKYLEGTATDTKSLYMPEPPVKKKKRSLTIKAIPEFIAPLSKDDSLEELKNKIGVEGGVEKDF